MFGVYDCETCDREFGSQRAANQHMDDTGHRRPQFECDSCYDRYYTQTSLNDHMDMFDHWDPQYDCDTCDAKFYSQHTANEHMDDARHWMPQFECDTCDRRFKTQNSADQHMNAVNHHRQNYCHDCNRMFQTENGLKMHLNSSIHRGKNIKCPFCEVALTTASGLSHHLETGSCPRAKNINHGTLFQAISQRDPGGVLTNKFLTYPDSDLQNFATSATWNGSGYECYLCHKVHENLHGLNYHLNSLAHSEKFYHCPNRSCNRDFVRLASLFNHLESESCNFVRFEKVQQNVHNIITGRRNMIGFV